MLQRTATHCTALYFTAAFCLEHFFSHLCYSSAIHSDNLAMLSAYVTATRCQTLQHTALNCNSLQHTVLSTFSVISVIRVQYTQPLWQCRLLMSLQHDAATHCNALPCTILHYSTRSCAPVESFLLFDLKTLSHSGNAVCLCHCNTLQHTKAFVFGGKQLHPFWECYR